MAGRTRTTKKLAQRIDRNYFKNRFPMPAWRFYLAAGLTALGLIWLAGQALAHRRQLYSSGPIVSAHAVFSGNCAACHIQQTIFSKTVLAMAPTSTTVRPDPSRSSELSHSIAPNG